MKDELQVENGNYTRIVNPLIEELIKIPFKGCELAVALFIIRKTYGFNKTQDEIPLTQFQDGLGRSRQTVVTALKNLQLVNVVRLVKRGSMKGDGNIWAINKYYSTWKLVNTGRLVKRGNKPSLTERLNLVQTGRQSKDTKYNISKDIATRVARFNPLGAEIIKAFEEVDPKNRTYYNNTTQRGACDHLIEVYGLEEVLKRISVLPKTNKVPYFPKINSPNDLKEKWVKLQDAVEAKRAEIKSNNKTAF